jgi:hypothetical protein
MTVDDAIELTGTAIFIVAVLIASLRIGFLHGGRIAWIKEQRRRRESAGLDPIDPIREEDIDKWTKNPLEK